MCVCVVKMYCVIFEVCYNFFFVFCLVTLMLIAVGFGYSEVKNKKKREKIFNKHPEIMQIAYTIFET